MSAEPVDSSIDIRQSRPLRLQSPSVVELLDAWERALSQSPVQRALTMLSAACPNATVAELARLSIGRRDSGLLSLRERLFGPQLMSLSNCPGCQERLELAFNVSDVRAPAVSFEVDNTAPLSLELNGYEITFRTPNSFDVMALDETRDVADNSQLILSRCLISVKGPNGENSAAQLPANVIEAITEGMSQADPQADVQLALTCPQCEHQWQASFDIVSFLWNEIDVWASRFLREVHIIASAYKWSEAEIFALTPWRRQMYLEMIGR